MRSLINISPDDSVLDVIVDCVAMVMFTLIGIFVSCVLLALVVFAVVSLIQGAVT